MFGKIDLRGVHDKSASLPVLQAYLQQLLSEPLLALRFSYGDELKLHLGAPREYATPKLKGRVKGAYVIGARASAWAVRNAHLGELLLTAPSLVSGEQNGFVPIRPADIERALPISPGAVVTLAQVVQGSHPGFGLVLGFSDGAMARISPEPPPADDAVTEELPDDIADWEVFTPYQRYLRVGPGPVWAYLPSVAEKIGGAASPAITSP